MRVRARDGGYRPAETHRGAETEQPGRNSIGNHRAGPKEAGDHPAHRHESGGRENQARGAAIARRASQPRPSR